MLPKRILLIEDDDAIRKMYQLALSQYGYQIESACDGNEAIIKLSQPEPKYDLVLLDIMMPKIDGLTVLKKIKKFNSPAKNIPIFVLTNLSIDELPQTVFELGANQFLIKINFTPKQLVDKINNFFINQEKQSVADSFS